MKKGLTFLAALVLMMCVFASAGAEEYAVKVSAPAGAPALALATLAVQLIGFIEQNTKTQEGESVCIST